MKINIKQIKYYLILFSLCLLNVAVYARDIDTISYKPILKYKFAKATPNVINDKEKTLFPFFEKLSALRESSDVVKTIAVVHIGDSHIQADFFTGTTRKLMNHYFGNPGRGLVAPNRLMRSNNGRHYRVTSTNQWKHSLVVKPNDIVPIGVTGLGLHVNEPAANISLLTVDESFPGEWEFNKITAYYNLEKAEFNIADKNMILARDTVSEFAESIILKNHVSQTEINFLSPTEKEISFFGFNLSNGKRGVFYHSIGINGAQYRNYNISEKTFCNQVSSLNPELIIISMGTNEAMVRYINTEQLYSEISDLVYYLRHASPNAIVMLTTPAESYTRNRRGPNYQVGKVRDIIINFAERNGYPCWDLYNITGGKGSAIEWNKKGLLSRDKIHLTQRGYEFQGEILFEAIVKSYNQYIKTKNAL